MKHLLVRTSNPDITDPRSFSPRVTLYVASAMPADAPSILISQSEDGATASVTVAGNVALGDIQNALASAARLLHGEGASGSDGTVATEGDEGEAAAAAAPAGPLVLKCDATQTGADTSLIFGLSDAGRTAAVASSGLYAAHHAVWDASGVSRMWGGASIPAAGGIKAPKGGVVVDGALAVSGARDNLAAAPAFVVFVDGGGAAAAAPAKGKKGAKGKKKKAAAAKGAAGAISTADAVARLEGATAAEAAAFGALLESSGAQAFVVGSAAEADLVKDARAALL